MKKATFLAAAAGLILACSTCAFSLAAEYGPESIAQQPSWPEGLADVLNSKSRVYGYFFNSQDFFYYSGDAATFNSFIKRLSELKDLPLTLILHPGRGVTTTLMDKKATVDYDWMVALTPTWSTGPPPHTPVGAIAKIELWLGGNVALDRIVVALSIEVKSSGEIDQFVAKHKAAKASAPAKTTDEPQ